MELNEDYLVERVTDVIARGIAASMWTVLPKGAHLKLWEDGKWVRGVDIVCLRELYSGTIEALTVRGRWFSINENREIGR